MLLNVLPGIARYSSITVWLVLLLLGTAPGPARGAELQVRGFLDQVSDVKAVPRSQPTRVKPLGTTQIPPDIDLVLMAKWSLNYLAGTVTVDRDFESSYGNWPLKYPPFSMAGDDIAGGDTECRNDLAFVLMREMSGLNAGLDIQKGVRQRLLKRYHASGLFLPVSGDTDVIWATTWLALGLIESYATTGDQPSLALARRSLEAMRKFAMKSDEHGHFWLAPPPSVEWEGKPIKLTYRAELDFCALEPYVRFFEVTGDAGMLAVAKGLADGRLDGLAKGHDTTHMHSMMHGVVPVAHLGAVTGEARYLDWAEARLKETEAFRTDYGWVAAVRDAGFSSPKISETCAVADVMQTAIFLARGGRGVYWDFVERAMRNYLPQEQFFIDETFKNLWTQANFSNPEALVKGMGLVRRMEGGFFCRTDPEDRWSMGTLSLEGCCPPTGMTALYLGWKSIVTKTPAGVFINLAFNTDTPAARVVSFLPEQGRITVVAKQSAPYNMRVPGFAPREKVQAWRSGKKVSLAWNGDYVQFASVQPGDELTVTYPLIGFVQKMKRAGTEYTIHWQGNAVTAVSPKGRVWPLFEKVPFPTPPYPGQ
jgi:hypothetical protein